MSRRFQDLAPIAGPDFIFYTAGWESVKEADLEQCGKLCSEELFII